MDYIRGCPNLIWISTFFIIFLNKKKTMKRNKEIYEETLPIGRASRYNLAEELQLLEQDAEFDKMLNNIIPIL